jgi:hypothetical protein
MTIYCVSLLNAIDIIVSIIQVNRVVENYNIASCYLIFFLLYLAYATRFSQPYAIPKLHSTGVYVIISISSYLHGHVSGT